MTDTADRTETLVLPGVGDGAEAPAARRRSGSLSAMLLPELQQLAGSLGIPTAKKKKSDLVTAIQAHRTGGGAPVARAEAPVARAEAPVARVEAPVARVEAPVARVEAPATAPAAAASAAEPAAPRTRTRRAATRPVAAAETAPDSSVAQVATATVASAPVVADAPSTSDAPSADAAAADSAPPRTERPPRQRRENGNRDNGQQHAGQQNGRPDRQPDAGGQQHNGQPSAGQQNNGQQNRPDRQDRQQDGGPQNTRSDRPQNDGQNSNNRQDRPDRQQGGQQNRQQSGQQDRRDDRDDDFDDDGTGRRRGRRYRDRNRNRSNRDRQGGGGTGQNDQQEPTVAEDDVLVPIAGIVDEVQDKNTWFVRVNGYFASPEDIYIQNSFVRRYNLRRGDAMTGAVRQVRDTDRREKYNPLVRLDTVNGAPPNETAKRPEFTKLTPLYPQERLRLETESNIITTRVIDLVMPIGKGQRALIVSPPKAGKTMVLQAIANAITVNNPECHLMVVLVDERPEEVTDMQRSVKGEVIASTFDRRPQEHTMVAELSIERAKRLVEMGHDVVVLLDSITRLGRAYNLAAPTSGRILSGGVDSSALYPPKRFLGAARNIENGGSLTIIATALVETGSAGDTVIFEEYKGTGNAELKLDRKIADKRVFPAVDVDQSSTRKEELLLASDEFAVVMKLRRVLHALDPQQAIDLLTDRLKKSRNNYEFLMQIAKTTPGGD